MLLRLSIRMYLWMRTELNLITRIKEHISKSLRLAEGKPPKNSMARHLVASGHHVNLSTLLDHKLPAK